MVDEEEESELPSAPRRKEIELGKGVSLIPPERLGKPREEIEEEVEKKEERKEREIKFREVQIPRPTHNIIVIIAIFFSVISLAISFFAISSTIRMKDELKGIAADLRTFKEANIYIDTKFGEVTHKVEASLPIKEIITPFTIPIKPQEVEGSGVINIILPEYKFPVTIPWNGTIAISGSIHLDTSQLSEDRKMLLSYELPGKGELRIGIKGSDLWTSELENITQRIEKMAS